MTLDNSITYEFFSFRPTFKIFMATNHKPKIKGVDEVIWRRIKLIPFTVTIPKEPRDKELTKKPIAENSGVFNWLLAEYEMWKNEGLEKLEAVRNANEEFRYDMDSVGTFVNEALILYIKENLQCRLSNKTLYDT